ncbi:hypothetical protein FKP32DRAFT_1410059 [Trametes sanguinea]|nr:hypothetical protein FKP32DRAFT_1410059 [Trametes sanguinea]
MILLASSFFLTSAAATVAGNFGVHMKPIARRKLLLAFCLFPSRICAYSSVRSRSKGFRSSASVSRNSSFTVARYPDCDTLMDPQFSEQIHMVRISAVNQHPTVSHDERCFRMLLHQS